jgi:flagellar operon protein
VSIEQVRIPSVPAQGQEIGLRKPTQDSLKNSDFLRTLEQVGSGGLKSGPGQAQAAEQSLKFSNHAMERVRSRGITFNPEEMKNIDDAVSRAGAKGSKDALILSGDKALIVSVKNKTVVTVMDRAAMKDNVFTNIDSTVVI